MSPSGVANSISSEARAAHAAWLAMVKERLDHYGRQGYFLIWVVRPLFDLAIAALIYAGGRRDLVPYLVVAMSANALLWITIYWVGEILDRERMRGTLVALFLAPCARLSWLLGFAAAGVTETAVAATLMLVAGRLLFDVRLHPNLLSLAVVLPLYLLALGGLGVALSGLGLLLKKANALSNLVFPVLTLLGGVYYPVGALPEPLRVPARLLPMGYGMDALSAAALHHAPLGALGQTVLPLAGFAVAYPLLGALAFGWLERLVRRRGEVDLY